MTARVLKSYQPEFARDYEHDCPQEERTSLAKRITLASLPFFALSETFKTPVSLSCDILRLKTSWINKNYLGATIAIVCIAGCFFHQKKSLFLTNAHDLYLNLKDLIKASGHEKYLIAFKMLKQIIYLSVLVSGHTQLMILSCLMQTMIHAFDSCVEYQKGKWIEAFSQLLLAGIQGRDTFKKMQDYKREKVIQTRLRGILAQKLGNKWRFPSDHLPIGVKVNGVNIVSWNVLNKNLLRWVTENNSQGLNGSLITDLDKPGAHDASITQREELIADIIVEMSKFGEMLALQECRKEFLDHVQKKIGSNFSMLNPYNPGAKNQEAVFYNNKQFKLVSADNQEKYPSRQDKLLAGYVLKRASGEKLRIVNLHIPGDPQLPGKEEAAEYIQRQYRKDNITTVAIGDHNFTREEMKAAYLQAGLKEFSLHSPNKTNIDPVSKMTKSIDHALIVGARDSQDLHIGNIVTNRNINETLALI